MILLTEPIVFGKRRPQSFVPCSQSILNMTSRSRICMTSNQETIGQETSRTCPYQTTFSLN